MMILKSRKNNNVEIKNLIDDFSAKINSIALVHDQLYRGSELEKITFKDYVNELAMNLLNLNGKNIHYKVDIAKCFLNIETTIPLGIILSELLINSEKHNPLKEDLLCSISVKKNKDNYHLRYTDNGKGLHSEYKNSNGMGLELIEILVRQLRGQLNLKSQKGMYCEIIFKEKELSIL